MRIKILENPLELEHLDSQERHLQVNFIPSDADILNLLSNCPHLDTLIAPSNIIEKISSGSKVDLLMNGVYLIRGKINGIKEFDGRYTLPKDALEKIMIMWQEGYSLQEIIQRSENKLNIPSGLTEYLILNNSCTKLQAR